MSDPQAGAVPLDPEPRLPKDLPSTPDLFRKVAECLLHGLFTESNRDEWIAALRWRADYLDREFKRQAWAVPDGITALLEAFEQAYADALEPGPNQRGRQVIFTQIDVPTFIEGLRNAVAARSVVAPRVPRETPNDEEREP